MLADLTIRVTIKELPRDEAGLREWCEDAWRRKDRLLGGFDVGRDGGIDEVDAKSTHRWVSRMEIAP